jgi:glycosyltransferase involved in cell wall biosynthesis
MICILHGYLLDGSGSNLWTQSILRTLCKAGETVHVMCQEPHPESFDFIAQAIRYDEQGRPRTLFERQVPYPGRCILHKPTLGEVLPVYVWDKYEEYKRVVPMVELDEAIIDDYLRRNQQVLEKILEANPITALHVNHAVLMSVVAQRVSEARGIPYSIMPHGSCIEYAVKKDPRFHRLAAKAFARAGRIFVIGPELRQRVLAVLGGELPGLAEKIGELNLGVDTSLFEPVPVNRRRRNVEELERVLDGVERGKRPEQSSNMRHRLGDTIEREVLRRVLSQAADYTAKHPDSDAEGKLRAVDWEQDKILLFVGRLIASKGIQCVLAAMPAILREEPRARLLVVGHGPLREPMEALLWAVTSGKRQLVEHIVEWGRYLEGAREPEPLGHLRHCFTELAASGGLDGWYQLAREYQLRDRVIFTGYLNHGELRYLFPCCDVAIFPSIVAEAGPLVFLEAMASGVFPMGIYQAGMAASIDAAATVLPPAATELMKLGADEARTIPDIAAKAVGALRLGRGHAEDLRRIAVERFDWRAVGKKLCTTLEGLRV